MSDLYIAVDLGAGSGRVFLAGLAPGEMLLAEVRRFHYPPQESDGHLRWDFPHIWAEIKAGLQAAGARARDLGRTVRSIGVDSWGVDYGLLDAGGSLLENPVCYRDARTAGVMEEVFDIVPRDEIFRRTGIQFLPFNTLYQLFAHTRAGLPADAARLLLIPDLINYYLTGRAANEYTNATTTQMVNAATGAWDAEILLRLHLPTQLLNEIVPAGTELGALKPDLAEELDLVGARVVAPATHDTGSAVAGAPLRDGWAYISSGTWSLVGVELNAPLINDAVARHNFTNEGGVYGTARFLKNVMGLWLLEACRREWQAQGLTTDYAHLVSQADPLTVSPALIYPDDPRFFNPPAMLAALVEQLAAGGQSWPDDPPAVTRMILDSLALRYASVIRAITAAAGQQIPGIQIVGGGGLNHYLNQATAQASALPVQAGPVEATVIGNILVQALAAGRFASLAEARRYIADNIEVSHFAPQSSTAWAEATRKFAELEARFGGS